MDIEDAFTSEAIEAAGTNVDGEDEQYLRDLIGRIYTSNELPPPNNDDVNVAALCFVAGRTYQSDLSTDRAILIPMTPEEIPEYIAWRIEKGST